MDSSYDSGEDIEPTEIISIDDYDKRKAKFQASLRWTLCKAYGGDVPPECKDLFYESPEGSWGVQPRVMSLLTSGQVYCLVCANCFQEPAAAKWQDHSSVIQALGRKGIYVVDDTDTAVTETWLMQRAPFRPTAHVAMMDALMRAYSTHVFSMQHVVSAVRRFAPVAASSELPDSTEGAAVFWVNKVCGTVKAELQADQSDVCIPMIEDLVKDVGDCCCLDTLVSFYCPEQLKFEEICLKPNVAIADSLHNASLLRRFCHHYLPSTLHLSYNDLLYTNQALAQNILALLADLFRSFELQRIPCVTRFKTEGDSEPTSAVEKVMSQVPPISAATKRSFHLSNVDSHSNTDIQSIPSQPPLLEKRALLSDRSECTDGPTPPDQPTEAWLTHRSDVSEPKKEPQPSAADPVHRTWTKSSLSHIKHDLADQSQKKSAGSSGKSSGSLLTNVSLDSEVSQSFGDDVTLSDDLDIPRPSSFKEPLLPAKLKPAKEKWSIHPKEVESGEKKEKSPTSPGRGKAQKQYSSSDEEFATPSASGHTTPYSGSPEHLLPGTGSARPPQVASQSAAPTAVTSREPTNQEQVLRSVASELNQPMRTNGLDTSRGGDESQASPGVTSQRTDGFYISGDSDQVRPLNRKNGPVPQTFTVNDRGSRQPPDLPLPDTSDPKSRNDSRSSGEFSDHESSKIHKDHKAKEANGGESFYLNKNSPSMEGIFQQQSPVKSDEPSPTTSFAQIKKQRENQENGAQDVVVMTQYSSDTDSPLRTSLKSQFQKSKDVKKKTSFAALPNQTTWQENAQKTMQRSDEDKRETDSSNSTMSVSDLSSVRLKLEAKRKMMEMEKKKAEAKLASQRQKLGKEAFLQVVGRKGSKGEEGQGDMVKLVPAPGGDKQQQFSREGIQNKIDGVKQRWFKDGSTSEGSGDSRVEQREQRAESRVEQREQRVPDPRHDQQRVQESRKERPAERPREERPELKASSERAPSQPRQDPRQDPRQEMSSSSEQVRSVSESTDPMSGSSEQRGGSTDSYESSFERLNASLSDLQGEILKLNLQQEQITKTITTPRTTGQEVVKPEPPVAHQVTHHRPPYNPYMMPGYTGAPYDPTHPVPSIPAAGMPGYPGMIPPTGAQYPYAGVYQNQYGMYPRPGYLPGQGHLPGHMPPGAHMPPGVPGMIPGSLPPGAHVPGLGYPVSTAYHPASTYPNMPGVTSSPSHLDSRLRSAAPIPHSTHQSPAHTPGLPISAQSPIQATPPGPLSPPSPSPRSPSPRSPRREEPPTSPPSRRAPRERQISVSGGSSTDPASPEPTTEAPPILNKVPASGFVITFDDGAPKRSKPKLRQRKDGKDREESQERTPKKEAPKRSEFSPSGPTTEQRTPNAGNSYTIQSDVTPQKHDVTPGREDVSPGRPEAKPSPPSGFVIEIQQTEEEEDIQRKKEKIIQQALKRQADMERKRAEKEAAQAKQREEKRVAKEQADLKKQEEKARRQEIFEAYKNKKRAEEEEAGRPKPTRPRASRPQRVAPPGVLDDKQSVCSSQGSQEDLRMNRSTSPGSSNGSRKGSVPNNLGYAKDDTVMTSPSGTVTSSSGGRRAESPGQLRSGLYRSQSESRKGFRPNANTQGQDNNGVEYSGPKLFVKPKSKSNRSVIHNAISHCCLAGTVGGDFRNTVLDELSRCESNYYLILFRDAGCQFRALYRYNPDLEEVVKLIGQGPKTINTKMLDRFYKYNSGSKSFAEVKTTKHLSVSIDAVTIQGHLWQTKRPVSSVNPGRKPVYR